MTRVLMVLTSHDRLGDSGRPTGFHVGEAAHPYAVLREAGIDVDFASPRGGAAPADSADRSDPLQAAFLDDPAVAAQLADTIAADQVDPARYDAVLFVGGHGTMWDFPATPRWRRRPVPSTRTAARSPPSATASSALVDLTLSDGSHLVAGKTVAGFTDAEEEAVGLTDVVPFLLASTLTERGARHVGAGLWEPHVEVDGRLVTGQNPASARPLGEALVQVLAER